MLSFFVFFLSFIWFYFQVDFISDHKYSIPCGMSPLFLQAKASSSYPPRTYPPRISPAPHSPNRGAKTSRTPPTRATALWQQTKREKRHTVSHSSFLPVLDSQVTVLAGRAYADRTPEFVVIIPNPGHVQIIVWLSRLMSFAPNYPIHWPLWGTIWVCERSLFTLAPFFCVGPVRWLNR